MLPAQQAETQPWDMRCIDLISKYRMTPKTEGIKYATKGKKRQGYLFTSNKYDRSRYRLERNMFGARSQSRPSC